tara:strand:- start:94 stop:507 length:414 start_codon:yes stop_codon:yes gene_type:complete
MAIDIARMLDSGMSEKDIKAGSEEKEEKDIKAGSEEKEEKDSEVDRELSCVKDDTCTPKSPESSTQSASHLAFQRLSSQLYTHSNLPPADECALSSAGDDQARVACGRWAVSLCGIGKVPGICLSEKGLSANLTLLL